MGHYIDINGLNTYYEMQGDGAAVLLLHGGGVTAQSWFLQIPALSERYRVYAPERRGHGRTADVEGPVTGEQMAEDTAAFLDAVGTGPAHVIGWSDGATVAVHLALRRPDLVRKLVILEGGVTRDGGTDADVSILDEANTAALAELFRPQYEPLSPDGPEHFPVVFAKWLQMWREQPDIGVEALAAVQAPTLVIQGDDGGVRLEHSAAMVRTLPNAQLAIVPGTSHSLPLEKPELVNRILLDFLAEAQAPKFMPLDSLDA